MRRFRRFVVLLFVLLAASGRTSTIQAQRADQVSQLEHVVQPGDTWTSLSIRFSLPRESLQAANWHPNSHRNPVIGDSVTIPANDGEARLGQIQRVDNGGLLQLAVRHDQSPWQLAALNGMKSPFRPLFHRAIYVPGDAHAPRDLPPGFQSLELSSIPAQPGWPLALRATADVRAPVSINLGDARFETFVQSPHLISIGGTGAFFAPGAPELAIRTDDRQLWSQPWRMAPGSWDFDQITLTGEAAAIDQEAIAAERARMFQIWSQVTPSPLWQSSFRRPIDDFLGISSTYGARRSYNGGPYQTYHEGVDFSAYRGAPVMASGDGRVVHAEHLYVRGGAVVIDHGLSVYSGYYHLSAVHVSPGTMVHAGDLVGEVGSEGLSSGNHLHWDLLVAETWVDASVWQEQDLACWILEGLGTSCLEQP